MAKWGEGDPRWIVEERPDATNVNNWHWTEKNASPWSKDRLRELLVGLKVSRDGVDCSVTEMDKIEGEASANNRKAKLIFFYEWDIKLKWEGRLAGGSELVKGELHIPNLSEENDVSEVDITVTVIGTGDQVQRVKAFMHATGREAVRAKLGEYVRSLREEFSKGLILPQKDGRRPDATATIASGFNKNKVNMQPVISEAAKAKTNVGCKLDTRTIELDEKFQCRAQELYDALTRVELVTAFTRAAVQLDPQPGGKFALWGNNVTGEFRTLKPPSQIEMTWRHQQWPPQHYSEVVIDITQKEDHTEMHVRQSGVPAGEEERTRDNWRRYYFDGIKRAFGFGAFL